MEIKEALDLVTPFASADAARTSQHTPFYAPLYGRPYVCATDGHSAAIVHCPKASTSTVPRPANADRPPPLDYVLPQHATRAGYLRASELEALQELPARWHTYIDFTPGAAPRLNASVRKGSKGKRRTIEIVNRAELGFKNTIEADTALFVPYLLRALEFCGVELVTVWRTGDHERDPVLFTCGSEDYKEAARCCIVMPVAK